MPETTKATQELPQKERPSQTVLVTNSWLDATFGFGIMIFGALMMLRGFLISERGYLDGFDKIFALMWFGFGGTIFSIGSLTPGSKYPIRKILKFLLNIK